MNILVKIKYYYSFNLNGVCFQDQLTNYSLFQGQQKKIFSASKLT